jgi:hypothetical protein
MKVGSSLRTVWKRGPGFFVTNDALASQGAALRSGPHDPDDTEERLRDTLGFEALRLLCLV